MSDKSDHYIPVLSFEWLTPLYDLLLKWIIREETFKSKLIQQANIQPKMKVLDLGCSTGTMTLILKRAHLEGEPTTIELTPEKSGEYGLQCQMRMLRGKLIVE